MLVNVNTILRFTVHYQQYGIDLYNMLHYRVINVTAADVMSTGHVSYWGMAWFNAVKAAMASSVTFVDVHVDEVNGMGFLDWAYPPGTVGANAQAGLPTTTPYSIRKVRGSRLTRNGWIRLPGAHEAAVTGNVVLDATRTLLNTNLAQLLVYEYYIGESEPGTNDIGVDGIIWAGNDPGYPTGKYQSIAGIDTRSTIGSQDSRRN